MPVAYSPYSTLYISHGTAKENLSNNPELCKLWIISVILMSLALALGVITLGEIRCLSL